MEQSLRGCPRWASRTERSARGRAAAPRRLRPRRVLLAQGAGWKEALDFEGSYVGLVGKILDDLPITEASPCWDVSANTRGLLDPGVLYIGYAEHGGPWMFFDADGRGALEVLADRSAYRPSAEVRRTAAELCAHRVWNATSRRFWIWCWYRTCLGDGNAARRVVE